MNVPLGAGNPVLILSIMMEYVRREGENIDEHIEDTFEKEGVECFVSKHVFCGTSFDEEYILTYILFCSSNGWSSKMLIGGRFIRDKISEDVFELFREIVEDEEYLEMFSANSSGVILGPFFSRNTVLKNRLHEKLLEQHIASPQILGVELWEIILETGGLPGLKQVWEELFDDEIAYYMRLEDPYCFDISGKYSCAPL